MEERDRCADTKTRLEAKSDIDAHHHCGEQHGEHRFATQVLAHLGADGLNPADLKCLLTELAGEPLLNLSGQALRARLCHRYADEKLVPTLTEVLHRNIGDVGSSQGLTDVCNASRLGEL